MKKDKQLSMEEIDIFEAIKIISLRKYFILSFVILSLLIAGVYAYGFRSTGPQTYVTQIVFHPREFRDYGDLFPDLQQKLSQLSNSYISTARQWFASGAYKAKFQENNKKLRLPDVNHDLIGSYIVLKMMYPDPEEGKPLLSKVFEIFSSSELSHNYLNTVKKVFNTEKNRVQLEKNEFENKLVSQNELLKLYETDVRDTKQAIQDLKKRLKISKNYRSEVITEYQKNKNVIYLYNVYHDTIIGFIAYLEKRLGELKYSIEATKIRTNELTAKRTQKQFELDNLSVETQNFDALVINDAPFAEPIYLKKYSNIQIIGLVTVLATFLGVVTAFILGIKDRREGVKRN